MAIDLSLGLGSALVICPDLRIGVAYRTNQDGDCIIYFADGSVTFFNTKDLVLSLL
jgi:hypothetical protein